MLRVELNFVVSYSITSDTLNTAFGADKRSVGTVTTCIALLCIELHYVVLYWTESDSIALYCMRHIMGISCDVDISRATSPTTYTVLYCIVLYCIVLYCIVLYCIVLYCIVLHCSALQCVALRFVVLCCVLLYCIVLYCIVLYCIVLYCIVLYCIVLYCIVA